MRINVELTGLSDLLQVMQSLSDDAPQAVADTINETVLEIRNEAVKGIQRNAASGRVYEKYNPRRTHRASAPGEYPASDTGRLAGSIAFDQATRTRLEGVVGTHVVYGLYLEFGTSRMAARPWLMPSFDKADGKVSKRLKRNLERRL